MSVQNTSNIPSNAGPNVNSPSSVSSDGGQAPEATETASTSSTSFYDLQQQFHDKQNAKRRNFDKTFGEKLTEAQSSPLDSEGGKEVAGAAGKAGMPMPPKHLLLKVASATRNNPEMKNLEQYVRGGLTGQDPSFNTPQGMGKLLSMANDAAKSGDLIPQDSTMFAGSAIEPTIKSATLGEGSPQPSNLSLAPSQKSSAPGPSTLGDAAPTTPTSGTAAPTAAADTGSAAQTSSPTWLQGANISTIIMLACTNSMDEDNKIKEGRLNEMQKFNKISGMISDYISNTLQPAQAALDKKTEGLKSDQATQARVSVDTWSNVDPDNLFQDAHGNLGIQHQTETERLSSTGLGTALTAAQGWQQTASNNSEQASNRFQSVDSRINATFSMLVGVLKIINDSVSQIIRNNT